MPISPALTAKPDLSVANFANELRKQTVGCRIMHERMYVRRALTPVQREQAAQPFDAEPSAISASKKLLDTRDPIYRAVVKVRSQATAYWKSVTTPFPEPGIRLIRRGRLDEFNRRMSEYRDELEETAAALQLQYERLKNDARDRLGDLYNSQDYPSRIDDEFSLDWDFPSIDPPEFLKKSYPKLYEQECERIRARFEESVRMTEQAFLEQFQNLVAHMVERLSGNDDGKPKVFRNTIVDNLRNFFQAFDDANIGATTGGAALHDLITQAQNALGGVTVDQLRESAEIRGNIVQTFSSVQSVLDGMMVNRPRNQRSISLEDEPASEEAA